MQIILSTSNSCNVGVRITNNGYISIENADNVVLLDHEQAKLFAYQLNNWGFREQKNRTNFGKFNN